ncbi:MAG: hypothetical protein RLZ00_1199 [Pseudomonadota bacterium]|jgi:hypothetical protein
MLFLSVHPRRLWATLNPVGAFEGQLTLDLEQYGLMTNDVVCDVTVSEDPLMEGRWRIWVKPLFDVDMPHFDKFVETLNHYVFEVLQFTPSRSALGQDLPAVKIFFDGIYFDMSGTEPVVQKLDVDAKSIKSPL